MRPVRTLIAALVVAGVVTLSAAPAWAASEYQRVLRVYEGTGTIAPCEFSGLELESALKGVDSYGAQYFADFTQAIQGALTARAAGGCSGSSSGSGRAGARGARGARDARDARGAADGSGPGVGIPAHLGSVTAATDAGVPAPLAVLGVLAVLGALAGAAALVVNVRTRRAGRT